MKALLLIFVIAGCSLVARPQGTVEFDNLHVGSPNAPVYESDGVTKLSGPQFMAELLGGPSANTLSSIATTAFLTGNAAGYFLGGTQSISGVRPGDTAWVRVDVWNTASGASFAQSQASGQPNSWWQSSIFSVTTGSQTVNPSTPGVLTGLGNSPVYLNAVPEPSTLALVGLGAAAMLFRIRRCDRSAVSNW